MLHADLSSRFLRAYSVVTDAYGCDPLRNEFIKRLLKIERYTTYEVTQADRGAPDLVSFNVYGEEDLWWHIMAYNAIVSYKEIVEGMTLKIPDYASIISLMGTTDIRAAEMRTVSI